MDMADRIELPKTNEFRERQIRFARLGDPIWEETFSRIEALEAKVSDLEKRLTLGKRLKAAVLGGVDNG
jgi:hypothetical protein